MVSVHALSSADNESTSNTLPCIEEHFSFRSPLSFPPPDPAFALQSFFRLSKKLQAITLTSSTLRYLLHNERRKEALKLQDYGLDQSPSLLNLTLVDFELEKEASKAIWPPSLLSLTLVRSYLGTMTSEDVDNLCKNSLACLTQGLFCGLQRVTLQPRFWLDAQSPTGEGSINSRLDKIIDTSLFDRFKEEGIRLTVDPLFHDSKDRGVRGRDPSMALSFYTWGCSCQPPSPQRDDCVWCEIQQRYGQNAVA